MDRNFPLTPLEGQATNLAELGDLVLLFVNVASACGATPQYEGLEALHREFAPKGFAVLGFPCNQFGGQEPGGAEQIREFCTTRYGVTFPMFAKIDVKGPNQHPLYAELVRTPDAAGRAGDVAWNFEKFLVDRSGEVRRFRTKVQPEDPVLRRAIEQATAR